MKGMAPVRAGDLLRDLDRRLLPPLARGLVSLGRGSRPRLLAVAAIGCAAAVLLGVVWQADRQPPEEAGIGDVVRVGLLDGQSIPGYVESSRTELDELLADPSAPAAAAQTYALVALKAYLAPDRLTPILAGAAVAEVFARVPLPGRSTDIVRIPVFAVPADVTAGMALVARRKEQEAADFERLSAKLTGAGAQERRLRAAYTGSAELATAEAIAYRSHCSCLYAAVVRATPLVLHRMAGRPEVRAVDPAPEVRELDRAVFLPPLPEQVDVATPPASQPPGRGDASTDPGRPGAGPSALLPNRSRGRRPTLPSGVPSTPPYARTHSATPTAPPVVGDGPPPLPSSARPPVPAETPSASFSGTAETSVP